MLEDTQKEAGPLQSYRLGGGRGRVWLSLTVGRTAPCVVSVHRWGHSGIFGGL